MSMNLSFPVSGAAVQDFAASARTLACHAFNCVLFRAWCEIGAPEAQILGAAYSQVPAPDYGKLARFPVREPFSHSSPNAARQPIANGQQIHSTADRNSA